MPDLNRRLPRLRHAVVLPLLAASLLSAACAPADDDARSVDGEYPMTVDNCGREVTIDQRPERLYVIGGEAGTLVHAAGGSERVGVFSQLAGEPLGDAAAALAAADQQPVQSSNDISREVIIGAEPDLVVTYGLRDFGPEELAAAGIPTLIISGYCGGFGAGESEVVDPLGGIYDDITLLGHVLGTEEQAAASVAALQGRVDAVRERAAVDTSNGEATAAIFVPGPDGTLGAYGRRSMIHQQMEYAGLTNVFEDTDERLFEPSTEALIELAPQRMIALYEPGDVTEDAVRETIVTRPELAGVPAVTTGDVMVLDFYYSGHGTLAVDGLERLAQLVGR